MFNYQKASRAQEILSKKLNLFWNGSEVKNIAGADCSYDKKNRRVGAKVVVCRLPDLKMIDSSEAVVAAAIPYVPGFLNFREAPAYIKAFKKLDKVPDITLVDGNGIAHPRRMGIASYLGVVLDISTIGCAKSPFFPFKDPDNERGCYSYYRDRNNEHVGYCLRSCTGVKPIFVSPGNRIDLKTSMDIVLICSRYRIPEPIRLAHRLAGEIFKNQ
jgi:deoxyribonuclease V